MLWGSREQPIGRWAMSMEFTARWLWHNGDWAGQGRVGWLEGTRAENNLQLFGANTQMRSNQLSNWAGPIVQIVNKKKKKEKTKGTKKWVQIERKVAACRASQMSVGNWESVRARVCVCVCECSECLRICECVCVCVCVDGCVPLCGWSVLVSLSLLLQLSLALPQPSPSYPVPPTSHN